MISCDFYEKAPEVEKLNLQSLFQIVENEKQKLIVSHPLNLRSEDLHFDKSKPRDEPARMGYPVFPTSMPTKGKLSSTTFFMSILYLHFF